jgi:superfamily I DNA and RNA helicase
MHSTYSGELSEGKNNLARSGVDVMITIFCDFHQFSAKKMAFFSKTNVMINFFQNLALFCDKIANFFAEFFGKNI